MTKRCSKGRLALVALAVVAAQFVSGASARAGIVTYSLSGHIDGALGATALADAPFTWTLTANNLGPTTISGFPALAAISSTISVGGLQSAAFLQPTYVFQSADASQFAFVDKNIQNGAGWTAPQFATETLGVGFGAQAASFAAAAGSLDTTLGALSVADLTGLSFSASVSPTPPVFYRLSGLVSGSLDGAAFTDAPFSWSVGASTDQLTSYFGLPALSALSGQIRLGGFGDLTPTSNFLVAVNAQDADFGFVEPSGAQGIALGSKAFEAYALGDPLSRLAVQDVGFLPVQTSRGLLDITSSANLVLTATTPTGAPEPSAWTLLVLGFGGLGSQLRRRRCAAVPSLRAA